MNSGSALFRSRECYGAEFSTVLFPLRHVPPLLPDSPPPDARREVRRGGNRGANETANAVVRVKFQPRLTPRLLSRGHERVEATGAKIQEPNRAGDVNFLALSSLMGFSSPLSLYSHLQN